MTGLGRGLEHGGFARKRIDHTGAVLRAGPSILIFDALIFDASFSFCGHFFINSDLPSMRQKINKLGAKHTGVIDQCDRPFARDGARSPLAFCNAVEAERRV
jgi:hypothetical protein